MKEIVIRLMMDALLRYNGCMRIQTAKYINNTLSDIHYNYLIIINLFSSNIFLYYLNNVIVSMYETYNFNFVILNFFKSGIPQPVFRGGLPSTEALTKLNTFISVCLKTICHLKVFF